MARLADELGERATLRVEGLDRGDECLELIPRNPAAARIAIEHNLDADDAEEELWVTVADEAAPEAPGDLQRLEAALRAVIAGRVRVIEGSGRHRVEIKVADGDLLHSTSYSVLRGLLPAPGWRRHAMVTQYEPYT